MASRMLWLWLLLWLCLLPLQTAAKDAVPAAGDPALEARMLRIAAELRCLVCQNQTIADSDAALAQDLRAQVRTMLRDGVDDDEIRRYMTDRYGDFVLYRPPLKATTLVLWGGPLALLLGGLAALAWVLQRRMRMSDDRFEHDDLDAVEHDAGQVEHGRRSINREEP